MRLFKIDEALDKCNEHLEINNAKGTEIEVFLTRYLLIYICAIFEDEIKKIIVERASNTKDPFLNLYVKSSLKATFRQIDTGGIAGTLKYFGPKYKDEFQEKVNGTKAQTDYNSIVNDRHYTAHNTGSNITFDDLVGYYDEGNIILDVLYEVVNKHPAPDK
jgi:hypothetical protein